MKVYVNGVLAGTAPSIHENFGMPTGAGRLGSNPTSGERMTGTIYRVTGYASLDSITWTSIGRSPISSKKMVPPSASSKRPG